MNLSVSQPQISLRPSGPNRISIMIRPVTQPVLTLQVSRTIIVHSVAAGGAAPVADAIEILVVQANQQIWNIGLGESRRVLYVGHLRLDSTQYQIALPYLTLLVQPNLSVGDRIVLSNF